MSAVDQQQILRIRRLDASEEPLLVKVEQINSASRSLELKLVATDQEHLYHGRVDSKTLQNFNYASSVGTSGNLETAISHAFLRELLHTEGNNPSQGNANKEDVELVAAMQSNIATITVRRNIDGITQKIGVINLAQDDEREEVAAFDWVHIAGSESERLREQLASLQDALAAQKQHVSRLTTQLDELVAAKKTQQELLLVKFTALLNAKKLKIRDQQRLLQQANITSASVEQTHDDPESVEPGTRGRKRKVDINKHDKTSAHSKNDDDTDEDDGFEDRNLDIDSDGGTRSQRTPEQSDAEQTDDEDIHHETSSVQPSQTIPGSEPRDMNMEDADKDGLVPPRRDLPFGKAKRKETPGASSDAPSLERDDVREGNGIEDDETDDEL